MSTAHELMSDAINGIFSDAELSRKAADAVIEALGLCSRYHVRVPTMAYRGGLSYPSARWFEYLRASDIERDWSEEPDKEVFWSLTSAMRGVICASSPPLRPSISQAVALRT